MVALGGVLLLMSEFTMYGHRALGIVLLYGPSGKVFLMSEAPLYRLRCGGGRTGASWLRSRARTPPSTTFASSAIWYSHEPIGMRP